MRITNATVYDLRSAKPPKRPILGITVDAMPVPTNDTQSRRHDTLVWTTAKYGPLIEFQAHNGFDDIVDLGLSPAGRFNVAFRGDFAPVVDVMVQFGGQFIEGHWAVQLRRSRNLLKRYNLKWRMLLSDHDAQNGDVAWTPQELIPRCAENFFGTHCTDVGVMHTTSKGIDYWYCPIHYATHNQASYATRVAGRN